LISLALLDVLLKSKIEKATTATLSFRNKTAPIDQKSVAGSSEGRNDWRELLMLHRQLLLNNQ